MTPMPLRALREMTDPLTFTGDQITYLDTAKPGPQRRPGIRVTTEATMPIPTHVDDWLVERYTAETTRGPRAHTHDVIASQQRRYPSVPRRRPRSRFGRTEAVIVAAAVALVGTAVAVGRR